MHSVFKTVDVTKKASDNVGNVSRHSASTKIRSPNSRFFLMSISLSRTASTDREANSFGKFRDWIPEIVPFCVFARVVCALPHGDRIPRHKTYFLLVVRSCALSAFTIRPSACTCKYIAKNNEFFAPKSGSFLAGIFPEPGPRFE